MLTAAWVAPNFRVVVRLSSTGSTATTTEAPAWLAPCTALIPIPPTPMTTTTSPGLTSAELTAEPHPVPTPHPVRHATSSGTSSGQCTAESTETVDHWLNVASPDSWPRPLPSKVIR